MMDNPTIVVAGASGYVGKSLIESLLVRFPKASIIALSRNQNSCSRPQVQWKSCDLFNLKSLDESLPPKIDVAFYLVHSMGPTANLDQGSFADYDMILADNFGAVVASRALTQLIYLSGLIPEVQTLSPHLKSRLEVEETFIDSKLPTTIFRAGLILGQSGSSFQILLKLVNRLPLMVCPGWTKNLSTPVSLKSVIDTLTDSVLDERSIGRTYDLAGCKPITYIDLMKDTALFVKKKRIFLSVPFFSPNISRLWVSIVTNTSKELVYPLIQSLQHHMVARDSHLYPNRGKEQTYLEILSELHPVKLIRSSPLFQHRPLSKTVRSIQRLPLPQNWDAYLVKEEYLKWLPQFLAPFIRVVTEKNKVRFCFLSNKLVLLDLESIGDDCSSNMQLLMIRGGLLASVSEMGRLEFREAKSINSIFAAIHDFRPSLPWFIYRSTQAVIHLWVMKAFAKHLQEIMGVSQGRSKSHPGLKRLEVTK